MEITPGLRLGPYKILKLLGSGGMGAVYLAYDERLDRHVALKMVTRATREPAPRRLLREARAVARLTHPNIAGLYDVFEHDHETFLVMEYVDGEPLTSLVKAQPVSVDRAVDVGLQLVDALRYAHRARIIHRDIKPANVMLTPDGTVKVLDLGLAHETADPGADTKTVSAVDPNDVISSRAGTPPYMAPERLARHVADARTDVYSVGVVLFELLTGRRPYFAPDLMTLAVNVATQATPRVAETRPDVPAVLDDLVARAMAKDPATRYASAADLHDALVRVRDTLAGKIPKPPDDSPKISRRKVLIGIGAAVIAALAIVSWLMFGRGSQPAPAIGPGTVAVLPVFSGSTDQADVDELVALLQSIVARNLAHVPGITIVPAPLQLPGAQTAAPGQSAPQRPEYTVLVTIRRAVSGFAADVDVLRNGTRLVLQQFTGDELALLSSVLEWLATIVPQPPAQDAKNADTLRNQLRAPPTRDRQALVSYIRGRRLLDTSDDPKTDKQAVDAFQDAINRDSSFAFAYAGLSQAYWSTSKHTGDRSWLDRARDAARHAEAIDPRCDQAQVALSFVSRDLGPRSDAVSQAKRASTLTPDNDDARRVLGLALLSDGQIDASLVELSAAAARRPHRAVNQYYLGFGMLWANRPRDAITPLKKATDLQPNFVSAWVNLGMAYLGDADWERSSGSSLRALDLNPTDSSAVNNLATAYYWDGKYELAVQRFQEAVKLDPESAKRQMNLGDALDAVGRSQEARQAYTKAVDLATAQLRKKFDTTNAGIAAKSEAKLGRKAEAERWATQAWEANDKEAGVVYKVAVVYALTGQPAKALDKLELAVKLGKPLWEVQADPDLKSLRNDPRFKSLSAKPVR